MFNEAVKLKRSIATLNGYVRRSCRFECEIAIVNNGSTDGTIDVANELAKQYPDIYVIHIDQPGRGRALKQVWQESTADIVSYMDVDLSSDLTCFAPMIEALVGGNFDLAVGSRLLKPALTSRSCNRELISRFYNILVRVTFGTRFSDAQCGFKALTRHCAQTLLPLVESNEWFFDTELLILAEYCELRLFELPVRWSENKDSRVNICRTAIEDLRGLVRLRRNIKQSVRKIKCIVP